MTSLSPKIDQGRKKEKNRITSVLIFKESFLDCDQTKEAIVMS